MDVLVCLCWSSVEPRGTERDLPAVKTFQLLYLGLIFHIAAPRARKNGSWIKAALCALSHISQA